MTYIVPQNRIFQVSTIQPTVNNSPRRAVILAPVAKLIRFDVASETEQGRLGYYDQLGDDVYSWPGKPSASKVDTEYTRIFIKNPLLKYFEDSASSGYSIVKHSSGPNILYSSDLSFATNTSTYPHTAAAFYDRGVKVGDVAKVRAVGSGDPITLWTTVKAIKGVTVAAVTGAAAAVSGNATTTVADADVTKVDGGDNCVFLTSDATGYSGLTSGYNTETYTLEVIEGSVDGDFTTAVIRVTSASGLDDVDEFIPAATSVAKDLGTRGLTVTFTYTDGGPCSSDAVDDGISEEDLVVGQIWTIEVTAAHTAAVATSGGTYTGTRTGTYLVEVTRGGLYADDDKPQITVSTDLGFDQSGPTNITAAASAVAIGSFGATIQFSATGLRKGDKYTVVVTAAGIGAMRYLELAHNIDDDIADATEVDLTLYIKQATLEVTRNRTWDPPETSFDMSQTELTIKSGLTATDPTWTDSGTLMRMDVYSEDSKAYGVVYAHVRYWRSDLSGTVGSVTDVGDLPTVVGGDDSNDNPLYRALRYGIQNGGNQPILFSAVTDPDDINSWASALGELTVRGDIGGVVPCSLDELVHNLAIAHVVAMGAPGIKRYRRVFLPTKPVPVVPIVHAGSDVVGHTDPTTTDGEIALFTIADDPGTSGTQYTRVVCTSANAGVIDNATQVGDKFRFQYGTDGFDGVTYNEYTIASIISNDEFYLEAGPGAAEVTPIKGEIWRVTSAGDEATEIAVQCGSSSDELITRIVPDKLESGTEDIPGYFAAAAWAALAYSVLPNQGLTNVELIGFSSVQRITRRFSSDQLDTIAAAGGCIITQDTQTGRIFTRHAVTTGDTDNLSVREEMMVRNKHNILYAFADAFEPFLGRTNTTDRLVDRIRDITNSILNDKLETIVNLDLGPQLTSINSVRVNRNAINLDRIDVFASVTGVAPNNGVDLYISF